MLEVNNRVGIDSIVFSPLYLCNLKSSRNISFFLAFLSEHITRMSESIKVPKFTELKGRKLYFSIIIKNISQT